MSEQTKTEHTSPKAYTAHKQTKENIVSPVTYEPIEPQNGLQRTFGYLLLLAVAVLVPMSALVSMIWDSIRNLFGW